MAGYARYVLFRSLRPLDRGFDEMYPPVAGRTGEVWGSKRRGPNGVNGTTT
jgi:hypothetical protein